MHQTEEEKAARREANRKKMKMGLTKLAFIVVGILLLPVVIRLVWGPIGINMHYSQGERKVQIVKVTTKGLLWKTYEFEGIIAPGRGIATTYVWDFSIDNQDPRKEELFKKLNDAFQEGRVVKIRYDQRAGTLPWRAKTTYFAQEVTDVY